MTSIQSAVEFRQNLSPVIENLLVARNLRGMQQAQLALTPGYCLRAAQLLQNARGQILIGTGFPVADTFETDGPVGAIALYECLVSLGASPILICGQPLSQALSERYRVQELQINHPAQRHAEAHHILSQFEPGLVISIERPGLTADGDYYNMRGESIGARAACFDIIVDQCQCPTIGIGDGGNEIGMGKVQHALQNLSIIPAVTSCDELVVADVSNWGVYGIIACLSLCYRRDLLAPIIPLTILQYLSSLGSVDGVTRMNELTEDGFPVTVGENLLLQLRKVCGLLQED
jgi:hypothetical protein